MMPCLTVGCEYNNIQQYRPARLATGFETAQEERGISEGEE